MYVFSLLPCLSEGEGEETDLRDDDGGCGVVNKVPSLESHFVTVVPALIQVGRSCCLYGPLSSNPRIASFRGHLFICSDFNGTRVLCSMSHRLNFIEYFEKLGIRGALGVIGVEYSRSLSLTAPEGQSLSSRGMNGRSFTEPIVCAPHRSIAKVESTYCLAQRVKHGKRHLQGSEWRWPQPLSKL